MPLNKNNTTTFHRTLYAGMLQQITILKRGDDQRQGEVVKYVLFECRRSVISKTGEPIAGEMTSSHRVTWHIPTIELQRVGINYLNSADRIIDDEEGCTYQPESTTSILLKTFSNHQNIDCLRIE